VALTSSPTRLADALLFAPDVFDDDRGYFKETYSTRKYRALGLHDEFLQDSVSRSSRNVVRGMHYDLRMSKLVNVLHGSIFDAIVDLRRDSPSFLLWQGFYLSGDNHRQLYVPAGFAHGFLALSDDVIFAYKHGALYDPATEGAIRWNDPELGIDWPLVGEPRVTRKDREAPLLRDSPFAP